MMQGEFSLGGGLEPKSRQRHLIVLQVPCDVYQIELVRGPSILVSATSI